MKRLEPQIRRVRVREREQVERVEVVGARERRIRRSATRKARSKLGVVRDDRAAGERARASAGATLGEGGRVREVGVARGR